MTTTFDQLARAESADFDNLWRGLDNQDLRALLEEKFGKDAVPESDAEQLQNTYSLKGEELGIFEWPLIDFYTYEAIKAAKGKCDESITADDIAGLPLPHWKPVIVYIITADDQIVATVRGNATDNARGLVWPAAGFIKSGETVLEGAQREIKEELGLELSGTTKLLPLIERHPLQFFSVPSPSGPRQVCCATVVQPIAVKLDLPLKKLLKKITLNDESVGVFTAAADDVCRLVEGSRNNIIGRFHPSSDPAYARFAMEAPLGLNAVRNALEHAERRPASEETYPLGAAVAVHTKKENFSWKGYDEIFYAAGEAIKAFGPPHPAAALPRARAEAPRV